MGSIKVVKAEKITKQAAAELAKAAKGNLYFKLNPIKTTKLNTKKQ